MHALGFSSGSWPLFRNADGTPQTPRESDGLPAYQPTTCGDGVTRSALAVSSSTLLVTSARGTTARVGTERSYQRWMAVAVQEGRRQRRADLSCRSQGSRREAACTTAVASARTGAGFRTGAGARLRARTGAGAPSPRGST